MMINASKLNASLVSTGKRLRRVPFLRWAGGTLIGNIVFVELFAGIPTSAIFIALLYPEEPRTIGWILWALVVCMSIWASAGVFAWFVVSRPLVKLREQKKSSP